MRVNLALPACRRAGLRETLNKISRKGRKDIREAREDEARRKYEIRDVEMSCHPEQVGRLIEGF